MPKRKKNLTAKQKLFVFHYCEIGVARYAALAAGYSKKSPDVQASRLLRKMHVHKTIIRRLYRRKKMLNDKYAGFLFSQKRFYQSARVEAAAYFIEKGISNMKKA